MKQLLQQALDALENPALPVYTTLRKEIRMALAAPQPEPVAWQFRWTNPGNKPDVRPHELEWREVVQTNSMHTIEDAVEDLRGYSFDGKPCYEVRPLYAAPVVREPLTDEQIDRIRLETREWHILGYLTAIRFARAIEAHHGIGGGGK